MDALTKPPPTASPSAWTKGDIGFIFFIALVLVIVSLLGVQAHREAMKTEGTKRNGEQWAAWLTQESSKRFEPGYAITACAGGTKMAAIAEPVSESSATKTEMPSANPALPASSTNTWGDCLAFLTSQTEIKDMRNPFTGKPPVFIPACNPADHSLVGSIVFDKVTANPPGSAVPTVTSQLLGTDSIGEKVQLKIAVCDKGSYAVKVAELEF